MRTLSHFPFSPFPLPRLSHRETRILPPSRSGDLLRESPLLPSSSFVHRPRESSTNDPISVTDSLETKWCLNAGSRTLNGIMQRESRNSPFEAHTMRFVWIKVQDCRISESLNFIKGAINKIVVSSPWKTWSSQELLLCPEISGDSLRFYWDSGNFFKILSSIILLLHIL